MNRTTALICAAVIALAPAAALATPGNSQGSTNGTGWDHWNGPPAGQTGQPGASCEDALEILAKGEPIDLLVSDVVMPGMDGPTMVREARQSRPELKILFMSGYAEEQLRKSIDIENVNFLPKPFSVIELAEAARRTMGAK